VPDISSFLADREARVQADEYAAAVDPAAPDDR